MGYVIALGGAAVGRAQSDRRRGSLLQWPVHMRALWVPVEEQQVKVIYGEDYRRYAREARRWWAHPPNHNLPSGTTSSTESTARAIATAPTRRRAGVARPSPVPGSAGENAAPTHRST